MTTVLLAAAGLLFFFGLLWPGKYMWLKWLPRIVGVIGTLYLLLLVWALGLTGNLPVIDGKPMEKMDFAISILLLGLLFWSLAMGLAAGRALGRFVRWLGQEVQETNM
jgi:hypothetical protein